MVSLVFRSMKAASADDGGDQPRFLWIKVRGGSAVEYETHGLRNVGSLLKKVKEESKPGLDHVPIFKLTLYQSEGGTASSVIQLSLIIVFKPYRCCSRWLLLSAVVWFLL